MKNEVPDEESIFRDAKESGYWTEEDDLVFKETDDHIKFLKDYKNKQKLISQKNKIQKQIDEAEAKFKEISNKRQSLFSMTAEYLVRETELFTLLRSITYRSDIDKPLWSSDNEFLVCPDEYKIFLIKTFIEEVDLSVAEYRKVARSGEWRLIWNLSKKNLPALFGRPIQDLANRQKFLIYWSRIYDSVYEDPKKPDDSIIEDDEKLDNWLFNRKEEQEEKTSAETFSKAKKVADHTERVQFMDGYHSEECICGAIKHKGKGLGENKRHDNNCPYGIWIPYTEEEKRELADRFYGRNSYAVRSELNKEQEVINQKGLVEEHHLRKDKRTREIYGHKTNIIPIYRSR